MKKPFKSVAAIFTSAALLTGVVPFSSFAYDTGVLDTSDMILQFGEMKSMELTMDSMPEILADDEIEDYLLGSHLDANNKAVYDAFTKLVNPSLEQFTVDLPETVSFQTKDIESDENNAFYNAVFSNCASGMEAASFDTPWIFWNDQNNTSVSAGNMRYTRNWLTGTYTFYIDKLIFSPAAYEGFESFDQVLEYKSKLEEAVDNFIVEGETTEQKIKSIHDQICNFTYYDLEGKFNGSVLSAFVEPGAVCEGYAKGFKLICDKLGIPTVCVFGNFDEEANAAHMWNYVQMDDGNWYAVDTTWDDYDGDYGLEIIYRYYLKGSDEFFVKHTEQNDYNLSHLEYPEIVSWNYGEQYADVYVTTTTTTKPTTTTTTTTEELTTTTTELTTTTEKLTTTTMKPTTTTEKPTTTTTKKSTTTTEKPTTTTTKKSTTTTEKPTTTTTKKSTTTTEKPTTTTTKKSTTTTEKTTTTTTKKSTTTTEKPTTTTTKKSTTMTTKISTTTTKKSKKTTTTTKITESVTTTTTVPEITYAKGDLNHDGKISIADLVCCANQVLGVSRSKFSCDVNDDNIADVFDVIIMRKIVINSMK